MTTYGVRPMALEASASDHFLHAQYLREMGGDAASSLHRIITGPLEPKPTPHLDVLHPAPELLLGSDAQFSIGFQEMLAQRHAEMPMPLVSADTRTMALSGLMKWMYPPSMHQFADHERIRTAVGRETARDFSFVVLGSDESRNTQYVAGCLAYMAESMIEPDGPHVLYVDDLVIAPTGQAGYMGISAFRELLARAAFQDVSDIELRARRQTSYKAFRGSPVMDRILARAGYAAKDHGVVKIYGEGDVTEYSHLIQLYKLG